MDQALCLVFSHFSLCCSILVSFNWQPIVKETFGLCDCCFRFHHISFVSSLWLILFPCKVKCPRHAKNFSLIQTAGQHLSHFILTEKNNTGSHTTEHSDTQPNLFIYYVQCLCWFYMFKCAAVIALHFPNKTKWKSMMVDSRLKCICVILGVVVFFLSRSEYRSSILIIWYFEYFTRRITIVHQRFRLHKYDGDCECNRQYVLVCKERRIKKRIHTKP